MRCFLGVLMLCGSMAAQSEPPVPQAARADQGSFYLNGIVYQYVAVGDYTVVAAAHPVLNHKFLAVHMRVYNSGQQSVTVKPEEFRVADALTGHVLTPIGGADLARRMRRPYNWARLAVNPITGEPENTPQPSDMLNPHMLDTMRAMAARAHGPSVPMLADNRGALYTDTPGALQPGAIPVPRECDTVCRLRNREATSPDVLAHLQRQTSPDCVEQSAFLANTITPQSDASGVLYFPMPKLVRGVPVAPNGKKSGMVRVMVPVGEQRFQFMLAVE